MGDDQNKKIDVVLLDLDILRYSFGALTDKHPFVKGVEIPMGKELLEVKINDWLTNVLLATGARRYEGYISGQGNWRYEVAKQTPYKGTRILPKPPNWQVVSDILMENYNPFVTEGYEADDALAIRQREYTVEGVVSCIASLDKDLKTVPGWHYKWKRGDAKEELWFMTEWESLKFFYYQMLIGDSADNIDGCAYTRKIIGKAGDKKDVGYMRRYGIRGADKLIDACTNELELYQTVLKQYSKKFSPREAPALVLENARLLYMGVRNLNELYNFPNFEIGEGYVPEV